MTRAVISNPEYQHTFPWYEESGPPSFDYRTYLRSPSWQSKRDACLQAASRRCQICNSTDRLNVHHRTYKRIGNESPEDLIVLCRSCHEVFHANRRLARVR